MSQDQQRTGSRGLDRRAFLRVGAAAAGGGMALPLLSACGTRKIGTNAAGLKTVSVRFNWTIKGEFTPFFVAREKGYYKKEGLDVQLLEGKSGTQAAQLVGTGENDFGYIPSVQVIEGINKGLPVKAIATTERYIGLCWVSWPDIPLTGPTSLYGHRVSISTSSTFFQVWPGFQRQFHIDASKIRIVHPDPSATLGLFLHRELDIMADVFYANEYPKVQSRTPAKLNVLRMSMPGLGFDPMGYLLVVNKSLLSSSPDVARRMARATLQGLRYTLDNTEEAINIMTRLYGSTLGADTIKGQVHDSLSLILQKPALGKATDQLWNNTLSMLAQSGVISRKQAPSAYYTNEFVS